MESRGAFHGRAIRQGDERGQQVPRHAVNRQHPAGHLHALVVVIASLREIVGQGWDIDGDLDVGVICPHPGDGWFEVGISGYDDHGIGALANCIIHQPDGDVDVSFLFLTDLVSQPSRAIQRAACHGTLLVFAEHDLDLGLRFQGLKITFLAIPFGALVALGLYDC